MGAQEQYGGKSNGSNTKAYNESDDPSFPQQKTRSLKSILDLANPASHIDIISQANEKYLPDGTKTYSTDFLSFSSVFVMSLET
jgi:hypothetical protein